MAMDQFEFYRSSEHEHLQQLSVDCVIFGYQDQKLTVLIPKLDLIGDVWALPGGFIRQTESIDEAALRILASRTGINAIYLEQFRVFGETERSSRKLLDRLLRLNPGLAEQVALSPEGYEWITRRFVSIGYYALVDMRKVILKKQEFDASIDWYPVQELPELILDHQEMVTHALETLRLHIDRQLVGFNLLPEKFTMRELRELYEAVFDRPFARNNFQKKMLDLGVLERLEKKFTGAANRAPFLYRFAR